MQFVINKSGERPRRGVAPRRAEETGMRDFSGPRAPPARYLQRPKGRRSVYKMTRSALRKASIFYVFLPPYSSFLASFLYRSLTKQNTERSSRKYVSPSSVLSYLDDLYRIYFVARCIVLDRPFFPPTFPFAIK